MLKLYGLTKSRALRCIWMLYEIDAPFELVRLSPEAPDFPVGSDINPNRKIPALVDGTTVMWESMAINLYLAQTRTTELSPRGRTELGDALDAVEANPVIASARGAVAVDALVVMRGGVGE